VYHHQEQYELRFAGSLRFIWKTRYGTPHVRLVVVEVVYPLLYLPESAVWCRHGNWEDRDGGTESTRGEPESEWGEDVGTPCMPLASQRPRVFAAMGEAGIVGRQAGLERRGKFDWSRYRWKKEG
jgi:hypothetical protein